MAYQKTGRNRPIRLKRTAAGKLVATRVQRWVPKRPTTPPKPKPLAKLATTTMPVLDRRPSIARTNVKASAPRATSRRPIRSRNPTAAVHVVRPARQAKPKVVKKAIG